MNEALFFITLAINFVGILLSYKFFNKTGLFVWIGFATVAANIEVAKSIDMFGLSVTLGNVIYGTIFLATDILSENYGGAEARKGVLIGFFTTIAFTIISQINLLFIPNEQDFVGEAMETVFGIMPRICIASIIAYLISNTLDTYFYEFIKKKSPKYLWLRNNGSTIVSQLIDSFLFTFIAFAGVFDLKMLVELSLTTYAVKVIVAASDTPFIYLSKKMHRKQGEPVTG